MKFEQRLITYLLQLVNNRHKGSAMTKDFIGILDPDLFVQIKSGYGTNPAESRDPGQSFSKIKFVQNIRIQNLANYRVQEFGIDTTRIDGISLQVRYSYNLSQRSLYYRNRK